MQPKKYFKALITVITSVILITCMLSITAFAAEQPKAGDVNGDGKVNLKDAVLLYRFVAGWEVELTEPCFHKGTVAIDSAIERTCTVDGKTAGVHCSVCGEVLLEQETLTAPGHTESDWIIDQEPIGSEDGLKHTKCTVCGAKIKEEVIPGIVVEGLAYTVNADGTTCTITGIGTYQGNNVAIPTKIDSYTVTAIGDKAFADQTQITSFFIPNTVTSIGTRAFYGCTGITEITIPESVTSIGTQIFYKASGLKTVYYHAQYWFGR